MLWRIVNNIQLFEATVFHRQHQHCISTVDRLYIPVENSATYHHRKVQQPKNCPAGEFHFIQKIFGAVS
jgi:hypothetical protein